jgi:PIN domain nuclease of toxin-antitoxin system
MTHLLDTHAWIQQAIGDTLPILAAETMRREARELAIADISIWEAAKLVELGHLELSVSLREFFELAITPELKVLPITAEIAQKVTTLQTDGFHKDPADQLIVATALVHGLRLISNDTQIRQWGGVPMLWKSSRG